MWCKIISKIFGSIIKKRLPYCARWWIKYTCFCTRIASALHSWLSFACTQVYNYHYHVSVIVTKNYVNCQLNIQVDYYHNYISVIIMRIFVSIDNLYFEEDHFDFIRNCKERTAQSNSSSEDVAAGLIFLSSFFLAVRLFLLILGRVRMSRIKTDAKWQK